MSDGKRGRRAMSAEEKSEESKTPGSKQRFFTATGERRTHSTLAKERHVTVLTRPVVVSTSLEVGKREGDYGMISGVDRELEKRRHQNSVHRSISRNSDSVGVRSPHPRHLKAKGSYVSQTNALADAVLSAAAEVYAKKRIQKIPTPALGQQPIVSPESDMDRSHMTPKIPDRAVTKKEILKLHDKVKPQASKGKPQAIVAITHRTSKTRRDDLEGVSKASKLEQAQHDNYALQAVSMNEDLAHQQALGERRTSVEMKAVLGKRAAPPQYQIKKRTQSRQFTTKPAKLIELPFDEILERDHESPKRQPDMKGYFYTLAQRLGTPILPPPTALVKAKSKLLRPLQAMATQTNVDAT